MKTSVRASQSRSHQCIRLSGKYFYLHYFNCEVKINFQNKIAQCRENAQSWGDLNKILAQVQLTLHPSASPGNLILKRNLSSY